MERIRRNLVVNRISKIMPGLLVALLLVVSAPAIALALDPEEVSRTAKITTIYRAIGNMDPDTKTRNQDYLAEKFVDPRFLRAMYLTLDFEKAIQIRRLRKRHVYFYVNARTKHLDKLLLQELDKGVVQVVNLGAGFDSRCCRFYKEFPKVKYFELDLPGTMKAKRKKVVEIIGKKPDRVFFVPIDFNEQSLKDVLIKAGYDPKKKTFFIWEGVTMFLVEEAVDSTLRFIEKNSAPGSSVVFDYLFRCVADGDFSKYPEFMETATRVSQMGEPYIFGIKEGKADEFVKEKGLNVLSDIGSQELIKQYLTKSDGSISGLPPRTLRITHAEVP